MSEIVNVNENLIIQRRTPTDTRGRVFALRFTMDNSLRPFSFLTPQQTSLFLAFQKHRKKLQITFFFLENIGSTNCRMF